jgi:hypothetical protein
MKRTWPPTFYFSVHGDAASETADQKILKGPSPGSASGAQSWPLSRK